MLLESPGEVLIHEILVPDCSDDGTPLFRAVLALLRYRNGVILLLLASSLMLRAAAKSRGGPPLSAEQCPHCNRALPDEWIKAAHSRVAGRAGGRPRILRGCPFCKERFGARELREHIPRCEKNLQQGKT